MDTAPVDQIIDSSKHLARRFFTICENRFALLMVEMQEERELLLSAILLALGIAVFGMLAIIAVNVAIVVLLWNHSPVVVLLALAGFYAICTGCLYWRLNRLLRDWQIFSATLDQLKKDRECLEEKLA